MRGGTDRCEREVFRVGPALLESFVIGIGSSAAKTRASGLPDSARGLVWMGVNNTFQSLIQERDCQRLISLTPGFNQVGRTLRSLTQLFQQFLSDYHSAMAHEPAGQVSSPTDRRLCANA